MLPNDRRFLAAAVGRPGPQRFPCPNRQTPNGANLRGVAGDGSGSRRPFKERQRRSASNSGQTPENGNAVPSYSPRVARRRSASLGKRPGQFPNLNEVASVIPDFPFSLTRFHAARTFAVRARSPHFRSAASRPENERQIGGRHQLLHPHAPRRIFPRPALEEEELLPVRIVADNHRSMKRSIFAGP